MDRLCSNEELDKLAGGQHGPILNSNDLERERGITILSKNAPPALATARCTGSTSSTRPATPTSAARSSAVLNMATGTLLLVDAYEGPMPQTRFVLQKSLERGLKPILVVNKIDRPDARPQEVVDEVFDLLVDLDAPDDVLDFQIIFASARQGWATTDWSSPAKTCSRCSRRSSITSRRPTTAGRRRSRCSSRSRRSTTPSSSAASPSAAFTPARSPSGSGSP